MFYQAGPTPIPPITEFVSVIGTTGLLSGLTPGSWDITASYADALGNVGPPSNPVTVTVT